MFNDSYELFYSTGGHSGPYNGIGEAYAWAVRLLRGSRYDQWISIVPRTKEPFSVGVPTVRVVTREEAMEPDYVI